MSYQARYRNFYKMIIAWCIFKKIKNAAKENMALGIRKFIHLITLFLRKSVGLSAKKSRVVSNKASSFKIFKENCR